jgi:3-oxoacyl-[acyl-carrier-protein] synthase-3
MLELKTQCGAFDFNLGCSGYVYGLAIVKGLITAKIAHNVLFVVAETYSKHIHNSDRTNKTIFGDAAAATIITENDIKNIGEFILNTDGSGYDKLIIKNGGARFPYNPLAQEKVYGEGNIYTDNNLYMNGPDIFSFTLENIPQLIEDVLVKNKISKEEIDYFVFHQANAFMLQILRKTIKIPNEKFYIDISETGNTVSATIPIALKKLLNENKIRKGNKILLAGFGVGLSWGATIIEI